MVSRRVLGILAAFSTLSVAAPARAGVGQWFQERPPTPYRFVPALDVPVLLVTVATWIGSYYAESSLAPPFCGQPGNLCDQRQVPGFDRAMMFTNGSLRAPADFLFNYSPFIVAGLLFIDYGPFQVKSYVVDLMLALEAFGVSGMIDHTFRYAVRRPRPYLYYRNVYPTIRNNPGATTSFFSGHVGELLAYGITLSWTFTERHGGRSPWTWVMWTGTVGIGLTVAVLRVGSGDHFFSDSVAGVMVGTGVGILVPFLHPRRSRVEKALATLHAAVGPEGYRGMSLGWAF